MLRQQKISYSHRNNVGREMIKMIILVDNTQKHGKGEECMKEIVVVVVVVMVIHTHTHTHTL
jgi:hypothetical protein